MFTPQDGEESLRYTLILTFKTVNNEIEYEALIAVLRITKGVDVVSLKVYCDSRLLINQVKGDYVTKAK